MFSCDTHGKFGKRSLLKLRILILISTMSFLSDTHIHITYLQWLLELKCKWYDEMFKWTTGTYGHFDLLHFGLLNYHRFLYCRLLPCITRRVNTCKSLLLRIHELASWTSCSKTADNWKCYRDLVGLNFPKVNYKRNFLGVTEVRPLPKALDGRSYTSLNPKPSTSFYC